MCILHVTRETAPDRRLGVWRSFAPPYDAPGRRSREVAAISRVDGVNLHNPLWASGYRMARGAHRGPSCRWRVTQHGSGSYGRTHRLEAKVWWPCPVDGATLKIDESVA